MSKAEFELTIRTAREALGEVEQSGQAFLALFDEYIKKFQEKSAGENGGEGGSILIDGCIGVVTGTARVRPGPGDELNPVILAELPIGTEVLIFSIASIEEYDPGNPDWYQIETMPNAENESLISGWVFSDLVDSQACAEIPSFGYTPDIGVIAFSGEEADSLIGELSEYGVSLTGGWTRDELRTVVAIVRTLDSYGVSLTGDRPWTLHELQVILSTVVSSGEQLASIARNMGYNVSAEYIFRMVFGYGEDLRFTIHRANSDWVMIDTGPVFARNDGSGTIYLGNKAFYYIYPDELTVDEFGNPVPPNRSNWIPWTDEYQGSLGDYSELGFSSSTLVGHEIRHTVNYKDNANDNGIDVFNEEKLDEYYQTFFQRGPYTLTRSYTIMYHENGQIRTTSVLGGTTVELDVDSGFSQAGRSSNLNFETVTDALNARLLNLYKIGPGYTLNENLAGLARQEQGEALWRAVVAAIVGPKPNTNVVLP